MAQAPSAPVVPESRNYLNIRQAESKEDIASIVDLFKAYTDSLGIDLAFQSFEVELDSLPGAYAPPRGSLLLATDQDGTTLGCFAIRSLPYDNPDGKICEAKRLYVTPEGRGKGTGQALVAKGIEDAREAGYTTMKLDSLENQQSAHKLYRRFGFTETAPYYHNPHPGTLYMSLDLSLTQPNMRDHEWKTGTGSLASHK